MRKDGDAFKLCRRHSVPPAVEVLAAENFRWTSVRLGRTTLDVGSPCAETFGRKGELIQPSPDGPRPAIGCHIDYTNSIEASTPSFSA
jgi:hypothetical protein